MQEKRKKRKIFLSIILFFTGILFFEGLFVHIQKNNIYLFKNDTYYEVNLKPNHYFDSNKIDANQYYIANSIQSIDVYFDYSLKNKTKQNIDYSYEITATLKSYADNGTRLIWTKDFLLKNIDYMKEEEINIKEDCHLDYQYYVNYMESFQEYFHIKTENYLYVELNMKMNGKESSSVLLIIPIHENVIEITMQEDNSFSDNNSQNINLNSFIIFDFIIIVIILFVIKILFYPDNEKSILKKYQDMILAVQNEPNISSNIIYLTHLKDLINIAVNHNSHIFHYQNHYYTILNNIYYVYILKKT